VSNVFRVLTVIFGCFLIWLIYQRDIGANTEVVELISGIPYGDKWGHFFLFGTLTFITILATRFHRFNSTKLSVFYSSSLIVAVIVTLEELSQLFIETRTFEVLDLTADALGITFFSLLARAIESRLIKRDKLEPISTEKQHEV